MNDKPTEYSLSRTGQPTSGRGVPASDLRIDPSAAATPPKPNYGTGKDTDTLPNLTNIQAPPSVLREMLREAEALHKHKQTQRKKKLYWYLFRVFFIALSVFMFFYFVGTISPQTFLDYIFIAIECAFCGAIFSLILAAICRPIHTRAQNACFADEFEELYKIEHLKDLMCQSNEKGQA